MQELRKTKRISEGLSVVTVKKALGVNGTRIEGFSADKKFQYDFIKKARMLRVDRSS